MFVCLILVRKRARKRKISDDESNPEDWKLHICSENNFPTAAGLASSAAGYACLGNEDTSSLFLLLSDPLFKKNCQGSLLPYVIFFFVLLVFCHYCNVFLFLILSLSHAHYVYHTPPLSFSFPLSFNLFFYAVLFSNSRVSLSLCLCFPLFYHWKFWLSYSTG